MYVYRAQLALGNTVNWLSIKQLTQAYAKSCNFA